MSAIVCDERPCPECPECASLRAQLAEVKGERDRLREGLLRAELDFRGVSGFVYTGPTDAHMQTAAAFIETAIDRARAALENQS